MSVVSEPIQPSSQADVIASELGAKLSGDESGGDVPRDPDAPKRGRKRIRPDAKSINATVSAMLGAIGPSWAPTPDEQTTLRDAIGAYLEEQDLEISPGWLLAIAVAGYALPRIMDQAALRQLLDKIKPPKIIPQSSWEPAQDQPQTTDNRFPTIPIG